MERYGSTGRGLLLDLLKYKTEGQHVSWQKRSGRSSGESRSAGFPVTSSTRRSIHFCSPTKDRWRLARWACRSASRIPHGDSEGVGVNENCALWNTDRTKAIPAVGYDFLQGFTAVDSCGWSRRHSHLVGNDLSLFHTRPIRTQGAESTTARASAHRRRPQPRLCVHGNLFEGAQAGKALPDFFIDSCGRSSLQLLLCQNLGRLRNDRGIFCDYGFVGRQIRNADI